MRRTAWLAAAAFLLTCGPAAAEAPKVVATIGPLHSLAASVMQGVGEPKLLLPAGASPHAYSLRPSEAAALQQADLVVWVGPALERFLEQGLDSLAPEARHLEVLEIGGLHLRKPREGGTWESHVHEGEQEGEHGHAHEGEEAEHADEDHDHDHEHAHGHEHGHEGEIDAHVWLDPHNAELIVDAVAAALAETDPSHAGTYRANAERTVAQLQQLEASLKAKLAPVADRPFIVFHDAYGYFEEAFGLNAVGSVTISPEQAPSARRVAELRDRIETLGAVCLFREPQFAPRLVETIAEGTGAKVGVLDPLGADLKPGPDAYPKLLENLADNLTRCLGETS